MSTPSDKQTPSGELDWLVLALCPSSTDTILRAYMDMQMQMQMLANWQPTTAPN
jgi:hypothetical protein